MENKQGKKPVAGRNINTHQRVPQNPAFRGHHHSLSFSASAKSAAKPAVPAQAAILQPSAETPPAEMLTLTAKAPALPQKHYELPSYQAAEHTQLVIGSKGHRKLQKRARRKRLMFRSAILSCFIVLGIGGYVAYSAYANMHKVFRGTAPKVAALEDTKQIKPEELDGEGSGRVNILLLGVGGPGHDGPDLTDTIMLLSVDPVNKSATMLSIPRDLWVQQPIPYFGKQQKINAAYESGKYHYLGAEDSSNKNAAAVEAGFTNLDDVVEKVTGIKINYHVLVNFQAFKQAVDAVGGVTVDVPTNLVDPTMAWENGNNPVLAAAGEDKMDGKQALLYARSRETSSDFARAERQRAITVALKDKVLTAGTLSNPTKIENLINTFGDNVFSDLSTGNAYRLYQIMSGIGDSRIQSVSLVDGTNKLVTTDRIGSTSIVRPTAGLYDYDDIKAFVRNKLADGYIVSENAPVAVMSETIDGANTAAELLKSYGYNVTATAATIAPGAAADTSPVDKLTLVDLSNGTAPYTLHYLENRYGVKPVSVLPPGVVSPDPTAKFVIIEP